MVACKVILAVALVSVAIVQINGKPVELKDQLTVWTTSFESIFKDINQTMTGFIGGESHITEKAKSGLNAFTESFKNELSSLSKSLESKDGVSDMVKEATKKWHSAVETYSKKLPEELNVKKVNEQFEETLKYITQNATELSKKAQGNTEVEKDIKDFTKKQIDSLLEQVKSVQSAISEKKA